MDWKTFIMCILIGTFGRLCAQEDSLSRAQDSGKLLEQSSDESPILDMIAPRDRSSKSALHLRSRLTQRFQRARGFTEGLYVGSTLKMYHRLTIRQGNRL